jgi:hypothetical protein
VDGPTPLKKELPLPPKLPVLFKFILLEELEKLFFLEMIPA